MRSNFVTTHISDMAMGWVNPWVGLGWDEDFHNYSGLGWVGSRSPQHAYSANVDSYRYTYTSLESETDHNRHTVILCYIR